MHQIGMAKNWWYILCNDWLLCSTVLMWMRGGAVHAMQVLRKELVSNIAVAGAVVAVVVRASSVLRFLLPLPLRLIPWCYNTVCFGRSGFTKTSLWFLSEAWLSQAYTRVPPDYLESSAVVDTPWNIGVP